MGRTVRQQQASHLKMRAEQRTIAVLTLLHGLVLLNTEWTLRRRYSKAIEERSAIDAAARLMTGV